MIERLTENREKAWESTDWRSLVEIALSSNVLNATFTQDSKYYYLKCLYDGRPEAYRIEKGVKL